MISIGGAHPGSSRAAEKTSVKANSWFCAGYSSCMTSFRNTRCRRPAEDGPGGGRLRPQDRPIRNLAVPFDQCGNWAAARDHNRVELPDRIGDRPVVAVDQQWCALIVTLCGMP